MTVQTNTNSIAYIGNGSTVHYDYDFLILDDDHLKVYFGDVLQVSGYVVSGVGSQSGGTVAFSAAPPNLTNITFTRDVPFLQLTDYQPYDAFPADSHERALDLLTMMAQQLKDSSDRSMQYPVGGNKWDAKGNEITDVGNGLSDSSAPNIGQVKTLIALLAGPDSAAQLRVDLESSGGSAEIGTPYGVLQTVLDGLLTDQGYTRCFSVPEKFGGVSGSTGDDQSAAVQAAVNDAVKKTLLRGLYDTETQINVADKESLEGQGNSTGLVWLGGNGAAGESVLRVAAANPATNALNGVTVKDLIIDMNSAQNLIGVDMLYASVQSMLDGIQVTEVGTGSIGFRVGKEWYARLERCSVRNASRIGTAVKIDSSVGQVNSVPLDVQINGADIGFDLDTSSNYIYNLDIPVTAHAENCNVGLRMIPGLGVRSGVIRGYFENNAVDVIWGAPGAVPSDRTQNIVWLGASFNPVGSIVRLYEGNHVFIGCDRISTLEVHENASVEIMCSGVVNIVNTTGDSNRVRNRPNPQTILSTSGFGNTALLPGREYNEAQTGSSTTAVFNIVAKTFAASTPANGRSARCVVTARRTYENTVKFLEFVLTQSSAGTWAYTLTGGVTDVNWSIAINSTTGAVTVTDNRSDTKVYTFTASPM